MGFRLILFFTLALGTIAPSAAHAEYRAYKLGVKFTNDPKEKETQVLTTLDDLQYLDYYKVTPQQTAYIIAHWMCWGRTDFKRPCAQPVAVNNVLPTNGNPATPIAPGSAPASTGSSATRTPTNVQPTGPQATNPPSTANGLPAVQPPVNVTAPQ
jgi:hypothetical protein